MNSVCIAFANGCPRSRVDAALLYSYFIANGWDIKQNLKKADLVLVSTCGVNNRSERKSMRLLSIANKKRRKSSKLIIIGCLAGINKKILLERFDACLIPPKELSALDQIINARRCLDEIKDQNYIQPVINEAQECFNMFDRAISEFEPSRIFLHRIFDYLKPKELDGLQKHAFMIRIAKGCPGECSYCAIKFAAGPLISKPINNILAEFDSGIKGNYKDFVLIAGDVGSYGQDIQTDICELLRNIFKHEGTYKVHLKEFNPKWFIKYEQELINIFQEYETRIGSVIFPVQSGSERILRLMRRGYTAAGAKECLKSLRKVLPEILICTHVLIGFPSETEGDFDDTVQFLKEVRFNKLDIYKYSGRPGTEAELIKDKVTESIKDMRVYRLLREFKKTAKVAL